MKEQLNSNILDRLYEKRGENFKEDIEEKILEEENNIKAKIEEKLKEKFYDDAEISNILEEVNKMGDINSKFYYKIGFADGFKFNEELNDIYINM